MKVKSFKGKKKTTRGERYTKIKSLSEQTRTKQLDMSKQFIYISILPHQEEESK